MFRHIGPKVSGHFLKTYKSMSTSLYSLVKDKNVYNSVQVNDTKDVPTCPGGVAQWTSHPPQEQEDPGSNPAKE
jgi:hypothetical protein